MRQASTVKIITYYKEDIIAISEALEKSSFSVVATSDLIYDQNTKKYHKFLSVTKAEAQ